jgi:predicted phosphodiesterase
MRRIALFSDVHGNLSALDAALASIASTGIEERYCLGDLVGYGPDPAGVIARMRGAGIPTVRGNYDDGVGNRRGECGCYYVTEQAKLDGAASYAFTDGALDEADHAWLAELPDSIRLEVDGLRVLLAHGSPRRINEYLLLDRPEKQLVRLATEAAADVICIGHIHIPYHRAMDGPEGRIHYVSSGSVGKPKDGDPRAGWVELVVGDESEVRERAAADANAGPAGHAGERWVGVVVHRVEYDVDAVAEAMLAAGLPATLGHALREA